MTTTQNVLHDDAVRQSEFVKLSVGLPWFRSLRLSHIVGLSAHIDGQAAAPIEMLIDGSWLKIAQLEPLINLEWYPQDRQTIRFACAKREFELELHFDMLMPNLFMGPNNPVVIHSTVRQRVSIDD